MEDAQFKGFITASTSKNNPLQTILELTLTPFTPNANGQGIPRSEAENIIKTAKDMPIKMYYRNGKHNGHDAAYPIGTISEVWLDDDDVIKARSIVWKEEYQQEDTFLRKETAEGRQIGTSWEVFYKDSVTEDNIEWLHGCVFAATCIVSNPAYGDKTLITSVAEMEETQNLAVSDEMGMEEEDETPSPMQQLSMDVNTLIDYIYTMYQKTYDDMREAELAKSATDALARLQKMMGMFQDTKASLQSENESLTKEISEIKARQIKDRLYASRVEQLAPYTQIDQESYDLITSLTDDAFNFMVTGFKTSASLTPKIKIPLSMGSDKLSVAELAKELKERNK
jgi:hypothetical protein